MKHEIKIGGTILFIAVAQFLIFLNIAAFVYPNYSVSNNYISDLGVGKYSYIFNVSIVILGILVIISAYLLRSLSRYFWILLTIAGIGAMGVGIFNENTGTPHTIFSLLTFLFSSLTTYAVFAKQKSLISGIWAFLGTVSLAAIVLFTAGMDLGIGKGGMERMIVIPILIFGLGFSTFMIAKDNEK